MLAPFYFFSPPNFNNPHFSSSLSPILPTVTPGGVPAVGQRAAEPQPCAHPPHAHRAHTAELGLESAPLSHQPPLERPSTPALSLLLLFQPLSGAQNLSLDGNSKATQQNPFVCLGCGLLKLQDSNSSSCQALQCVRRRCSMLPYQLQTTAQDPSEQPQQTHQATG